MPCKNEGKDGKYFTSWNSWNIQTYIQISAKKDYQNRVKIQGNTREILEKIKTLKNHQNSSFKAIWRKIQTSLAKIQLKYNNFRTNSKNKHSKIVLRNNANADSNKWFRVQKLRARRENIWQVQKSSFKIISSKTKFAKFVQKTQGNTRKIFEKTKVWKIIKIHNSKPSKTRFKTIMQKHREIQQFSD